MIDVTTETLLSLPEALRLLPSGRQNKRPHISTTLRWVLTGAKAPSGEVVRLDAIRLGGKWITSREALQRFGDRLTPDLDRAQEPAPRPPARRRRASEKAARQLEKLGI